MSNPLQDIADEVLHSRIGKSTEKQLSYYINKVGTTRTKETKAKISKYWKEHKKAAPNKGKKHSDEHRAKISAALTGVDRTATQPRVQARLDFFKKHIELNRQGMIALFATEFPGSNAKSVDTVAKKLNHKFLTNSKAGRVSNKTKHRITFFKKHIELNRQGMIALFATEFPELKAPQNAVNGIVKKLNHTW